MNNQHQLTSQQWNESVSIRVKIPIFYRLYQFIGSQLSSFFTWFIMVIRESVTIPIIWGVRIAIALGFAYGILYIIIHIALPSITK